MYKFFMSLWPVTYLLFPILNLVAKATVDTYNVGGSEQYTSKSAGIVVWLLVGLLLALNRLASMAYS